MAFREAASDLASVEWRSQLMATPAKLIPAPSPRRWASPRRQYKISSGAREDGRRKGRSELGTGALRQAGPAKWAAKPADGTSGLKRKGTSMARGLKEARPTRSHETSTGDAKRAKLKDEERKPVREE